MLIVPLGLVVDVDVVVGWVRGGRGEVIFLFLFYISLFIFGGEVR